MRGEGGEDIIMYIDEYEGLKAVRYRTVREIRRDGSVRERKTAVPAEHSMTIYVNGREVMEVVCTGQYLAELILGRLLTAGIIKDVDEVESVCVGEAGEAGMAVLRSREAPAEEAEVFEKLPAKPAVWKEEWVFALADRFAEGMPIHQETFAVHSCFLSMKGEILFECEDIGRHNAFDKVIGYALRNQIDLKQCIVYLSGRVPADMAEKAVRAGIPVLAAKAAATYEAVQFAKEHGLTLICPARRDQLLTYDPFGTR